MVKAAISIARSGNNQVYKQATNEMGKYILVVYTLGYYAAMRVSELQFHITGGSWKSNAV